MTIQISSDVKPGKYTFNVNVILNGIDYGLLPCTINVVP